MFFLERSDDGLRCIDGKGVVHASVDGFQVMLGRSKDERIGLPITEGATMLGEMILSDWRLWVKVDGKEYVFLCNGNDESENDLCRYTIGLGYTKIQYECFNDKHLFCCYSCNICFSFANKPKAVGSRTGSAAGRGHFLTLEGERMGSGLNGAKLSRFISA